MECITKKKVDFLKVQVYLSKKDSRRLGNAAIILRKVIVFFFLPSSWRSTVLALFYSGPGLYDER